MSNHAVSAEHVNTTSVVNLWAKGATNLSKGKVIYRQGDAANSVL